MLGQCGSDMRSRLESLPRWDDLHQTKDVIGLKELIRSLCYHISTNLYSTITALNTRLKICGYRKQDGKSMQDYMKEIHVLRAVVK